MDGHTMPELCAYVTERATEGPCVADVEWGRSPAMRCLAQLDDHCKDHGEGTCTIDHAHHVYLGPVLARCGHEEGEHKHEHDADGEAWLRLCNTCMKRGTGGWQPDYVFHAYAAEPVHA